MGITDSHVHFWNPNQLTYEWLESLDALNKTFDPAGLDEDTSNIEIDSIVFVECNALPLMNRQEVEWVNKLASADPRIKGIVAFADLTNIRNIEANLNHFADQALVKGVRHNIQGNPPGFCLKKSYKNGVKLAGERGLVVDICITHDQLPEAIELMCEQPDVTFVLDHCAKPNIAEKAFSPWKKNMSELAKLANVNVKISGLLTESGENPSQEAMLSFANHVVSEFGPTRLLYGGDWPVCTLAGGYQSWWSLVSELTKTWSESDKEAYFNTNAARIYNL